MRRNTVQIIIEEDFGRMIDLLLNTEQVRSSYHRGDGHTWTEKVQDEFIRTGLRHLSGQQLSIIEDLLFEDFTLFEISQNLHIAEDDVYKEIQRIRKILLDFA